MINIKKRIKIIKLEKMKFIKRIKKILFYLFCTPEIDFARLEKAIHNDDVLQIKEIIKEIKKHQVFPTSSYRNIRELISISVKKDNVCITVELLEFLLWSHKYKDVVEEIKLHFTEFEIPEILKLAGTYNSIKILNYFLQEDFKYAHIIENLQYKFLNNFLSSPLWFSFENQHHSFTDIYFKHLLKKYPAHFIWLKDYLDEHCFFRTKFYFEKITLMQSLIYNEHLIKQIEAVSAKPKKEIKI